MKRWQTEIVTRELDKALVDLRQADTPARAETALERALLGTRAGLNERHRQQIEAALRMRRQQRGY